MTTHTDAHGCTFYSYTVGQTTAYIFIGTVTPDVFTVLADGVCLRGVERTLPHPYHSAIKSHFGLTCTLTQRVD